jgi:hypothetical protein
MSRDEESRCSESIILIFNIRLSMTKRNVDYVVEGGPHVL